MFIQRLSLTFYCPVDLNQGLYCIVGKKNIYAFNANTDRLSAYINNCQISYSILPLNDGIGLFAGYNNSNNQRLPSCHKFNWNTAGYVNDMKFMGVRYKNTKPIRNQLPFLNVNLKKNVSAM